LAQVHQAVHHNGTKVAVKIRRPNIIRDVEADLSLMQDLAQLIERHIPEAQTFDPVGLVNQFTRTIRREMNFIREGRTIKEFSRLFRNDATLVVPEVFEELTTEAVITMTFVGGCRTDDKAGLEHMGLATRPLAANGARIFMKQAFELGVFHGDPHPGNIRILKDGSVCLLDYGMVGTLDDDTRETLVDLILAIHRRNVHMAVDLMLVLGEAWRAVDIPVLRADLGDFIENYYGIPLERVHVGRMLSDFVSMVAHHGIRFPCDLMLLVRALVALEGVGRDLDPEFNLAEHLAPFIEQVVRERYNPQRLAQRMYVEARAFMRLLHDTPLHLARTIEKLSEDEFKVQLDHRGIDNLITELDRSGNRLVIGLVLASLIVASALVISRGTNITLWFSVPVFTVSSLLGVWLIYGIFRSGRL
jgi:ubiquinone biosynthesis protein